MWPYGYFWFISRMYMYGMMMVKNLMIAYDVITVYGVMMLKVTKLGNISFSCYLSTLLNINETVLNHSCAVKHYFDINLEKLVYFGYKTVWSTSIKRGSIIIWRLCDGWFLRRNTWLTNKNELLCLESGAARFCH